MLNNGDASSETSETILDRVDGDKFPKVVIPELVVQGNVIDDLVENESPTPLALEDGSPSIKPRPYQTEMLEESLERNIIIAMDTGSGKTHIAVMRMVYELERMPPTQRIWFLAPTVTLCSQQYKYIKTQISSVVTKFLSGADNVDRWTEQRLWNAVLKNVKIVVCTYAILLDALTHAFVKIESISLIVFDEAHNCLGNSAGARIMQLFYHSLKAKKLPVRLPHILGLTASPVLNNKAASVVNIEQTLAAISRTPKKHHAELRLAVKLPKLSLIYYQSLPPESLLGGYTRSLASLGDALGCLKITDDPYYISLLHAVDDRSIRTLEKIRLNQKTWCRTQIKSVYATALRICRELGGWAADYYISKVVDNTIAADRENMIRSRDVSTAEREYLAKILKQVGITQTTFLDPVDISPVSDKVTKLLEILVHGNEEKNVSGIVFVTERAVAACLTKLISIHPLTREIFRVGTVVGSSSNENRSRTIGELVESKSSENALSQFKSGKINLLIATSVLEEGIDIPACNVVICFQKPSNLKSFIQRRGRARHHDSKLIMLLDSVNDEVSDFEQCEREMRAIYENDMRTLQEALIEEDADEESHRSFTVASTGAILDLYNSVSHLHHFCATLPTRYLDLRPDFICDKDSSGRIRARVILPLSVHESIRTAESRQSWKGEKNAIRDASFEAYLGLYKAGLISENLLPLYNKDNRLEDFDIKASDTRASIRTVNEVLDPWINIAKEWNEPIVKPYSLKVSFDGADYRILLPRKTGAVPGFFVFWDAETKLLVDIITPSESLDFTFIKMAQEATNFLLKSTFGHRFPILAKDFIMPILVDHANFLVLNETRSIVANSILSDDAGLVTDRLEPEKRYIFQGFLPQKPPIEDVQTPYEQYDETPYDVPHISMKRLTRRADFLHQVLPDHEPHVPKEYHMVLPVARCTMDSFPFKFVRFGMVLPSIMRRLEIYLIAEQLSKSVLRDVQVIDTTLVLTAICASSADEATNYQRQEFLGDSILKLCVAICLMAQYPLYPEGYLSMAKDRVISNRRLCKAALDLGLDNYIVTRAFTGHKWRPLYTDKALNASVSLKREMSSKVLADVVEALIGAAMIDGGFPKALRCLQLFIPEIEWQPLEYQRELLYTRAPNTGFPATLGLLEELLGYNFNKKGLLIEAVTHGSYKSGSGSLERLEFLGDAILDHVVVTAMLPYDLSHIKMHSIRTAVVNAEFLTVMCMELCIEQEIVEVEPDSENLKDDIQTFRERPKLVPVPLWKFMRHLSPAIGRMQAETENRYAGIREEILLAIREGTSVPWALLAGIGAQKFYSDIVESIIGAVWIDSGSFETCTAVVEKMGILTYLRRIIQDGVHVLHPKEEIGHLAEQEKVKYILKTENIPNQTEGAHELCCVVQVGDEEVVRVGGGLNKEEIQVRAAEQAVKILKDRKEGWKRKESTKEKGEDVSPIVADVEMLDM